MLHRSAVATAITVLLTAVAVPAVSPVLAQEGTPRSQLGEITQYVAGTRLEIDYRRPVAHGRALFGGLVPYGRVWTPSADTAARIIISRPITIDGSLLAAGSYSIWAIPDSTMWTVIFSGVPTIFHMTYPAGHDVLRVQAKPGHGDYTETLEFTFPMVDVDSARLELRWGNTVLPLSIKARR